jgi:hypothetical protein
MIGVSGGRKMERQRTLLELVNESEVVFDEEDRKEMYRKENEEPPDLADQAYEQWRDDKRFCNSQRQMS